MLMVRFVFNRGPRPPVVRPRRLFVKARPVPLYASLQKRAATKGIKAKSPGELYKKLQLPYAVAFSAEVQRLTKGFGYLPADAESEAKQLLARLGIGKRKQSKSIAKKAKKK